MQRDAVGGGADVEMDDDRPVVPPGLQVEVELRGRSGPARRHGKGENRHRDRRECSGSWGLRTTHCSSGSGAAASDGGRASAKAAGVDRGRGSATRPVALVSAAMKFHTTLFVDRRCLGPHGRVPEPEQHRKASRKGRRKSRGRRSGQGPDVRDVRHVAMSLRRAGHERDRARQGAARLGGEPQDRLHRQRHARQLPVAPRSRRGEGQHRAALRGEVFARQVPLDDRVPEPERRVPSTPTGRSAAKRAGSTPPSSRPASTATKAQQLLAASFAEAQQKGAQGSPTMFIERPAVRGRPEAERLLEGGLQGEHGGFAGAVHATFPSRRWSTPSSSRTSAAPSATSRRSSRASNNELGGLQVQHVDYMTRRRQGALPASSPAPIPTFKALPAILLDGAEVAKDTDGTEAFRTLHAAGRQVAVAAA